MRLERFRVGHFRSVKDSGWIDVGHRTVLVGRNESGKTNLLLALRALDAAASEQRLPVNRDFPADLARDEYRDELDVVQTIWALSSEERQGLADVFPRATEVTHVEVARGYPPGRRVRFCELPPPEPPVEKARKLFTRITEASNEISAAGDPAWQTALEQLGRATAKGDVTPREWAHGVGEALSGLQQPLQLGQVPLADEARAALEELADLAAQITNESEYENAAARWVLDRMPPFLFLDQYPEIEGEQNLAEFVMRQREKRPEEGDAYFEMLLTVAGIDPASLEQLLSADAETRRQTVSRAGAVLTRRLREVWSDRPLKVRFNLDGESFNTLVSDPNAYCDVEVNLNQRSRGFRWFFSFYVMFAAGAKTGSTQDALLLLDEPGMHLHAVGQRDLLDHLAGFQNQIVFATQSPFMVPTEDLGAVKTVTISEDEGTRVGSQTSGDEATVFPLIHALGSEISKSLFGDEPQLVVPHVTDYWFLRMVSDYLAEQGKRVLPKELEITPSGGAANVPYLVALLGGPRPGTLVLCSEGHGDAAGGELLRSRLFSHENLVFVGEGFETPPEHGADIEDLLDPDMYDRFVRFSYRRELKEKDIEPDASIPRVRARYAQAFERIGLEFASVRPARLILRGAAQNPDALVPDASRERFERLFTRIREKFEALKA